MAIYNFQYLKGDFQRKLSCGKLFNFKNGKKQTAHSVTTSFRF